MFSLLHFSIYKSINNVLLYKIELICFNFIYTIELVLKLFIELRFLRICPFLWCRKIDSLV